MASVAHAGKWLETISSLSMLLNSACNSFPQAAAGTSVPLFSHTGAGDCHKGLLPLQVPAAKRGLSRLWAAGVLGMLEKGCQDNQAAPGAGWVASGLAGTVADTHPEP